MLLKKLKNKTYLTKNKIIKPTDLLSNSEFVVLNKKVSSVYGLTFSAFLSAILTKYQSLSLSPRFQNRKDKEFWYTEQDSRDDIGISYYMRKKAIKIGKELGLWKCEAKYNKQFPGIINKTDHFIINWDIVIEFFINLDKKENNSDAEEEFEADALTDEIDEVTTPLDPNNITDDDIEQYANEMSSQDGIKSKSIYKITIIENGLNKNSKKHKETINKIKIWKKLQAKKQKEDYTPDFGDKRYEHFKGYSLYFQNIKYNIIGILEVDEEIGIVFKNETAKRSIKISKDSFKDFTTEYFYNNLRTSGFKNIDTGEFINV